MKKYCKFYIKGKCEKDDCKFIHEDNICRDNFFSKCKLGDNCKFKHVNNNNKKKNTESFKPNFSPPDMRVLFENGFGKEKYNASIQGNDVIYVSDLFKNDTDIYQKILNEVYETSYDKEKLIIPWHENCHFIIDDNFDWKKNSPTFNFVVDKLASYFSMDVKATRCNWYKDLKDHKFMHHDGAAIKPHLAKTQNFTIGVSFGKTRELAFEVANHKDCRNTVSFPLENGSVLCFAKDVNINWRHGILPVKVDEDYKVKEEDGRISIILWGWI
jgi:hypothetical protein